MTDQKHKDGTPYNFGEWSNGPAWYEAKGSKMPEPKEDMKPAPKVQYVVSRTFGRWVDYLMRFEDETTVCCPRKDRALKFDTMAEASDAMIKARRLVPEWTMGGGPINYSIVIALA